MDFVKRSPTQRTTGHRRKYHHLMPGLLHQQGLDELQFLKFTEIMTTHVFQTSVFVKRMPFKWSFLKGFQFGQWYLVFSILSLYDQIS